MSVQDKKSLYRSAVPIHKLQRSYFDQGSTEGDVASPRRVPPSPSPIAPTPSPLRPSLSLSLSDVESSPVADEDTLAQQPFSPNVQTSGNTVLVVSALDLEEKPQSTELPVSTVQALSPVRVICHKSPQAPPPSELRRFSSDFVGINQKPPVDHVTPPAIVMDKEKVKEKSPSAPLGLSYHLTRKPDSNESSSNSSGTDDSKEEITQKEEQEFVGLENEEQGKGDPNIASNDTVLATKSHADSKVHFQTTSFVSEHKENKPTKSKKKGSVRTIPSRYMSAASNFKKPPDIPSSRKPAAKPSTKVSFAKEDSFKKPLYHSRSKPFNLSTNLSFNPSVGATTSTPSQRPVTSGIKARKTDNASSSFMGTSFDREVNSKKATKSVVTTGSAKPPVKRQHTNSSDICSKQSLLDIRLLQMTFLNVKTYKALKEQEKQAQSQLYALWEACETQRRELAELKKAIEYKKRTEALNIALKTQVTGLEPVCNLLSQTHPQHSVLSRSLDATRHELPVKEAIIPSEEDLHGALVSAEQITGNVLSCVRSYTPDVTTLANNFESLVKTIEKEFVEVNRLWTQIQDVTKTQIYETSLHYEEQHRLDGMVEP